MIVTKTPLRISLFGGGTDLPAFCDKRPGQVLSCTIDKDVVLVVSRNFENRIRAHYSAYEDVACADQIQHPLIRECLAVAQRMGTGPYAARAERGLDVTSLSDIPGATGLGASSSFTVGLLRCLGVAEPGSLAQLASEIEITRCGNPIGRQDQYAAAFGGWNRFRFDGDRVSVLPLASERAYGLNDWSVLFWLGLQTPNHDLLRRQSQAITRQAQTVAAMARMAGMVEDAMTMLCAGYYWRLGEFLHEAWMLKRSLTAGITSPEIDALYDLARQAGALGGKVLGAGGRGFLYFIAPPDRRTDIASALGLRRVPFRFVPHGCRVVYED